MAKIKLLAVVVPFIKRKIDDPSQGYHARVFQVEMSSKFVSQTAKHGVDDWASVGAKEHGVAISRASFLLD